MGGQHQVDSFFFVRCDLAIVNNTEGGWLQEGAFNEVFAKIGRSIKTEETIPRQLVFRFDFRRLSSLVLRCLRDNWVLSPSLAPVLTALAAGASHSGAIGSGVYPFTVDLAACPLWQIQGKGPARVRVWVRMRVRVRS